MAALFQQFDLKVVPIAPAAWPAISICMIVKDEADNLRPCLESLEDLASETIVVDTGSTDDTVEIARSMGARVFHIPWTGDFSAARNESLRHATKEWILWLDADNRLTPEAVAQIKAAVASGCSDCFGCRVSSPLADGTVSVTEYLLLFRNGLGVHFRGAIHESIMPTLLSRGLRLAHTDIPVQHLGYETPQLSQRKSARNLSILNREMERCPDDLNLLFYRGQARFHLDDLEGAREDLDRFLAATAPQVSFNWKRFMAYTVAAIIHEKQHDLLGMDQTLEAALREFPAHPNFLAVRGRLRLAQGHPEEALPQLQSALAALSTAQLGTVPPRAALQHSISEARAVLSQGDPSRAAEYFAEAIRISPSDPDNYRHLALAFRRLGLQKEAAQAWRCSTELSTASKSEGVR